MTEQQWLACADPHAMLDWLLLQEQLSDRKARLFGAACCRRLWPLLTDERGRTAVEFAEWYADGEISAVDLREASNAAFIAWEDAPAISDDPGEPPDHVLYGSSRLWRRRPYEDDPVARRYLAPNRGIAAHYAAYAAFMLTVAAIERVVSDAQEAVWFGTTEGQRSAVLAECRAQAALLRDVCGPIPYRGIPMEPAWLTWNGETVVKLAAACYEERTLPEGTLDRARLAVLADALEEAGCADAGLLGHLRSEGPHVRGCAAIDAILGKE